MLLVVLKGLTGTPEVPAWLLLKFSGAKYCGIV